MTKIGDYHSFILDEIDGVKIKFWFMIAPPEPEIGYNEAYMESCYVTDMENKAIDVSDEDLDRLTDLTFNTGKNGD